jgi:hypothetical protein
MMTAMMITPVIWGHGPEKSHPVINVMPIFFVALQNVVVMIRCQDLDRADLPLLGFLTGHSKRPLGCQMEPVYMKRCRLLQKQDIVAL